MELEEVKKSLKEFAYTKYGTFSQKEAKLILQALDNSIPKEKVKAELKKMEENGYWNFLEERDVANTVRILNRLLEE